MSLDIRVLTVPEARHEDEMDDSQSYETALSGAASAPQLPEYDRRWRRLPKRCIPPWVALAWAVAAGAPLVFRLDLPNARRVAALEPPGQIWRTPVPRWEAEKLTGNSARLVIV
jgi:hypothetical protein